MALMHLQLAQLNRMPLALARDGGVEPKRVDLRWASRSA